MSPNGTNFACLKIVSSRPVPTRVDVIYLRHVCWLPVPTSSSHLPGRHLCLRVLYPFTVTGNQMLNHHNLLSWCYAYVCKNLCGIRLVLARAACRDRKRRNHPFEIFRT